MEASGGINKFALVATLTVAFCTAALSPLDAETVTIRGIVNGSISDAGGRFTTPATIAALFPLQLLENDGVADIPGSVTGVSNTSPANTPTAPELSGFWLLTSGAITLASQAIRRGVKRR
jgi:hypothetical protein